MVCYPFNAVIDCGGLTDPEGGQVTFTPGVVATTDTGLDAVATYTCNSSAGYMLFDTGLSPTRTCQDSGLWSGEPALCTRTLAQSYCYWMICCDRFCYPI